MRKIKECICDSTEKVDMEDGNFVFPICLAYFLKNMASLLLIDTEQRLMQDFPAVTIRKEEHNGRAKKNATFSDALSVLTGGDLARSIGQYMQLQGFLEWFMEQDEPEDNECISMWFDLRFLTDKWNEYVNLTS